MSKHNGVAKPLKPVKLSPEDVAALNKRLGRPVWASVESRVPPAQVKKITSKMLEDQQLLQKGKPKLRRLTGSKRRGLLRMLRQETDRLAGVTQDAVTRIEAASAGPVGNAAALNGEGGSRGPVRNDDFFNFFNPADPAFLIRQQILDQLIDPRHNVDRECGYPAEITPIMYHLLYQRMGLAAKCVNLWPRESWAQKPVVFEQREEAPHDPAQQSAPAADLPATEFEADWNTLLKRIDVWHWLHRIDRLSGIGRFGILLLGIDDGKSYTEPATGLDDRGLPTGDAQNQLLFVRAFDETACQVLQREVNPNNPRYGQPTRYLITFRELDITEPAMLGTTAGGMVTSQVHWTRIVHVADNRDMSEIYGLPRMKQSWNVLQDIRKTSGGSAEMFWKGGFPGISFEMTPGVGDLEVDDESLREEISRYMNGLQRYIAVMGLTAKSLTPQIADPRGHLESQVAQLSMAMDVPKRIFEGSERGELASSQDTKAWNARVMRRQEDYLTPLLVRPVIDRLIHLGAVRAPRTGFNVYWPDLNTSTDLEKADLAQKRTAALQAYVMGQVDQLIPPKQYLMMMMGMSQEQAEEVVRASHEYVTAIGEEWPEVGGGRPFPQPLPAPPQSPAAADQASRMPQPTPDQRGQSVVRAEAAAVNPAELS